MEKLHYSFVYDENGRILYLYDLQQPQAKQFIEALLPLEWELYRQLKWGKCETWSTCITNYIKEARQHISSPLFRPPYGRISFGQLRKIKNELELKPVMWSLLSGDFDTSINGEQCAENVLKNFKPGDIIVFHDSEKAFERLRYALPLVLEAIRARGWVTEKLQ
jgi:hypothetical protein